MYIYGNKQTGKLDCPHLGLKELKKCYWEKHGWVRITDHTGERYCILAKQNESGEYEFVVLKKREFDQYDNLILNGFVKIKDYDLEV